jgi:UDP-glucose 4-epimerase
MFYLVTGGAGFIGSNIVEELLARGEKVRVLDNLSTGRKENILPFLGKAEFVEGDIRDAKGTREAMEGIDVVLHQAAIPSVPRSVADPLTSHEVNITGTLNVLLAARDAGVKRVVNASSSSVYGDSPELPKHERMQTNPLSPYAVTKLAAERYCAVFANVYGLETVSLRYFNVFGPRQDPTSQYSAVIPKFITAMMKGERPTIYGDGEQSRDFTYISNVIEANLLAARADCDRGLAANSACHDRITLNQLVAKINGLLGKDISPIYADPRPGDIKHSYADISLAERAIGYKPSVDFMNGLKRTVEWYRAKAG